MILTELNPKGNFDSWDKARLREIKNGNFSEKIGKILYEGKEFVLWQIELKPFERLPFRLHKYNYSCTCFSEGLALSRNLNGQIALLRFERGDHFYKECREEEMVTDFENVGENPIKIAIVEERMVRSKQTQTT